MRKKLIALVLITIILSGFSALSADEIRFIAMGDSRHSGVGAPYPWIYQRILKEVGWIGVDMVFNTGDIILCDGHSIDKERKAFREFMDLHKPYPFKLYVAPGNHDYDTAERRQAYHEIVHEKPYYSFNYKGAHFISLNTEIPGQIRTISGDQWEWLKKDLEKNKNNRPIFVFMHRPMYSRFNPNFNPKKKENFLNRKERDKVAGLFTRYGVNSVFSGHEHSLYKETHGGIKYFITGGAGAPLYGTPLEGGLYHYILVTIDDDGKVKHQVILPGQINVVKEDDHNIVVSNTTWEKLKFRGIQLPTPEGNFHLEAEAIGWKKQGYSAEVLENKDGILTIGIEVPRICNMRVKVVED